MQIHSQQRKNDVHTRRHQPHLPRRAVIKPLIKEIRSASFIRGAFFAIKKCFVRLRYDAPVLKFYENAGVQVDVPMPVVIEELVARHKQNGGVVPVLDIEATTRTPEHLVAFAYHVAEIASRDREHLTPDGESHPQASGKRDVPDVVEFLVTAADTHEEHLVYREPPVSIEAHVEARKFAHMVRDTALRIHGKGIRRDEGACDCKQNGCQDSFHTANTRPKYNHSPHIPHFTFIRRCGLHAPTRRSFHDGTTGRIP